MKKFLLPLFAATTVLFTSCSEDFEVAAPYQDISVVYGYLDIGDTAHYVRIQKAFLDEKKSAVTMAKEADSNFYGNLSVRIERYLANDKKTFIDSVHLNRVDLAAEGYTKDAGLFFNTPNFAYKFTDILAPNYFYRLKITNLATGRTDSADAPVIDNSSSIFNVALLDDNLVSTAGMSFYSLLPNRYLTLDVRYARPGNYVFKDVTSPAFVTQLVIRFNWVDSNVLTQAKEWRSADFDAGYQYFTGTSSNLSYRIDNKSLYNAISAGMGDAPDNVIRLLDRCDLTVYMSTQDFEKYRQSQLIQGTGLTGSEITPVYTNVEGENVLGLFTSRAVRSGKVTISARTIDSLVASDQLAHTNLRGTNY